MMRRVVLVGLLMVSAAVFGQGVTSSRPGTVSSAPSSSVGATARRSVPATLGAGGAVLPGPRNIEVALSSAITVDVQDLPLEKLYEQLRQVTQTNLVVNWNAFAEAGVRRDMPVTLHLKNVPYEQVVRTLVEVLPTKETRANYTVDENTLEITTNAELAIGNESHMYDMGRAFAYSFNAKPTAEEVGRNGVLVMTVLHAELTRAGDQPDAHGHSMEVKASMLSATASERGQGIINRTVNMFNAPLKVGQLASGTQLTAAAKRTQEAYKAFLAAPGAVTPEVMARVPEKYPQFNIALLPGTKEELGKEKPEMGAVVNDGGVLLLGPREAIGGRTSLAVYDLRDLIKKMAGKSKLKPVPGAGEFQAAIVELLQRNIKPEGAGWGGVEDLGKKAAVMVPYNGLLIVFGTAEVQRTVAAGLQDMNK
jgi:hypothetical protein